VTPGKEQFTLEIGTSPLGACLMKLTGPLTLQTLFEFQDAGRKETSKPVVVDLTDVPYMDSAGLGCVISIFASCQRTNRGFGIFGVAERLRTLFVVTHVDGLLPCFDSLSAADAAAAVPAK
jgi:anti-anti-sigma factor